MFEPESYSDVLEMEHALDLFPGEVDSSFETGFDQASDETGSTILESPYDSSAPASPHSTDIAPAQQVPVEFSSNAMEHQTVQSPTVKSEPEENVDEPPIKRERVHEDHSNDSMALVPFVFDWTNPTKYLQSLAKGRSEDVDMYRNMLKCHNALTPELDKQLKHLSRQVKNRESAQISRKRKREYVELLRNVISKLQASESSVRSQLSTAQADLSQKTAEAERWQSYAHELQNMLRMNGIAVPQEPSTPRRVEIPVIPSSREYAVPDSVFDGPCGFGHMNSAKTVNTVSSRKRSSRSECTKRQRK